MNWPVARLGEVCEVISGATPKTGKPEFWGGHIPWVTPKDLSSLLGEKKLSETSRSITRAGLESCSAKMLPVRSVLLSSRAPIGLVAINEVPVCTNQGLKSLVPRRGAVLPDFLFWWLKSRVSYFQCRGRGATFKEVSKRIVADLRMPLPPLREQQRIAAILDKADLLRRKRQATVAHADAFTQSIFVNVFGDPATNPLGWPTTRLEELFEISRGGSPRPINDYITEAPDGVNWIMIGDAPKGAKYITTTRKKIKPEGAKRSRSVKPGDFLLTNSMSFGRPLHYADVGLHP